MKKIKQYFGFTLCVLRESAKIVNKEQLKQETRSGVIPIRTDVESGWGLI